jgi:hypothetical protein
MRPLLVLLALAGATSAQAQPVQDRYGPPRRPSPTVVVASLNATPQGAAAPAPVEPYRGPMLRWPSKTAEPARPQPIAAAPPARPAPTPEHLPPYAPPPPGLYAPAARPAPQARVAPAQTPARTAAPPAVAQARSAPPAVPAAARSPAPVQPTRLAAAPSATPHWGGAKPRFYSLHREYGMEPDHIPEPPSQPRYVLIGPPDPAKAPAGDDDKTKPSNSSAVF